MRTIFFIFVLFVSMACAKEIVSIVDNCIMLMEGNDQVLTSPSFIVEPHWKVTVTSAKVGPIPDIRIFVKPESGTFNTEILHTTKDGTVSAYYSEGGKFRLKVIGFDAAWTVKVTNTVK